MLMVITSLKLNKFQIKVNIKLSGNNYFPNLLATAEHPLTKRASLSVYIMDVGPIKSFNGW